MNGIITRVEYFGHKIAHPDATPERVAAADDLLTRVNNILSVARHHGYYQNESDPDTGTHISGVRRGQGDGGFRLQSSTTGTELSEHRNGCAIDIYDPFGILNMWLTDERLAAFGLYREHPDATSGWCHLQSRPPRSGLRTFRP